MNQDAVAKLREIVYHRCKMWDAAREAEEILGYDVATAGVSLDVIAAGIGRPIDAFSLPEKDLEILVHGVRR